MRKNTEVEHRDMETYRFEPQDAVFFERHSELTDKQVRLYLRIRKAIEDLRNPGVLESEREQIQKGEGVLGIEHAELVMDAELLCELGFILRRRGN